MFWQLVRCRSVAVVLGMLACAAFITGVPARAQVSQASSLALTYTDAQGPGCLTITGLGDDTSAGGSAISVTLVQNGVGFSGQGESWVTSQNAPRTTALAFWLTDDAGVFLFFDGTLQMGVDTQSGQGQWTELQDPSMTDQWQAFRRFGGPGPAGCAQP